MAARIKAA